MAYALDRVAGAPKAHSGARNVSVRFPAIPSVETSATIIPARPSSRAKSRPDRMMLAIGAVLTTAILFPISDIASKHLTHTLPAIEVAWLRYAFFCIAVLPMLGLKGVLRTGRPLLQVARGAASGIGTLVAIVAFSFLPVGDATAIGFIAPVFVTGMAAVFLHETVGWRRWIAAAAGFIGVLIIVRPQPSGFDAAALLPLLGAVFSAASTIATRLVKGERSSTTMIFSAFVGTAVISVPTAFHWVTPSLQDLPYIAVCGGFAVLANLTQIVAYSNGPASSVAPFGYTQIIWASMLSYLVFGNVPGIGLFLGAAVIAGSGIYTGWLSRAQFHAAKTVDSPKHTLARAC